ncbi:RNA polymerase sigma factor [Bacillus alkalicellulosilyticus]|uniref:RNA polymerase sigma factor n=1 Tax=Alkalihalobacterium alkalicellulosilyticum TaxID=1912214 RepID=UPI000996D12A|nr:RNA polymerase sigma factor [Bacillus alkalicellulosilyticus]
MSCTGEEVAEWYSCYSIDIFKYIYLLINDYQQAEDLTQETFVRAYKNYDSFEGRSNPKTWLFSIARNITFDYLRKKKTINVIKELLKRKSVTSPLPEETLQVKEESDYLVTAINKLKKSHRDVIILRKIKGFSIRETSEVLNWTESKVKSTLPRALLSLEKEIQKGGYFCEQSV